MGSTQSLLSPTIILKEGLMLFKNNLVMGQNVYRDYEAEFAGDPKKGGSATIRKPVKFTVTKARTRTGSNITEQSITLTVATQAHVSWSFNSKDLTLSIEEYSKRYIRPAMAVLANTVDADLCALYKDVYNVVWESTGFVTPHTFMVLGKAMQRLDEESAPPEDRVAVINPAANWSIANALAGLYAPEPATTAVRKGRLGTIAGMDIFMDQNIKTHTPGTQHDTGSTNSDAVHVGLTGGTGVPTGADISATANKSMIMIDFRSTLAGYVLKTGDFFSVAGVYAVNPMSGESTGTLKQFVVTVDVTTLAATETTSGGQQNVSFLPAMINTGAYKTVDTVPATGAVVYFYWTPGKIAPQNMVFQKNAFALVMVPLEMPSGGVWGTSMSDEGFAMRIVKQYDIDTDDEVCRIDILYGMKTVYPELAVRVMGAQQ